MGTHGTPVGTTIYNVEKKVGAGGTSTEKLVTKKSIAEVYLPPSALHIFRFPEADPSWDGPATFGSLKPHQLWEILESIWAEYRAWPDDLFKTLLLESAVPAHKRIAEVEEVVEYILPVNYTSWENFHANTDEHGYNTYVTADDVTYDVYTDKSGVWLNNALIGPPNPLIKDDPGTFPDTETVNTDVYFENFSDSIGCLINIESLKDRSVIPVSDSSKTGFLSGADCSSVPSILNYNTIHKTLPNKPSYKTYNITKEMGNLGDDLFKSNMALIRDPMVIAGMENKTYTWKSIPTARSDGIGTEEGTINKGQAHGRNLVTDSRHYDRMWVSYEVINSVLKLHLHDMYRVWEFKRYHASKEETTKMYTELNVEDNWVVVNAITLDKANIAFTERSGYVDEETGEAKDYYDWRTNYSTLEDPEGVNRPAKRIRSGKVLGTGPTPEV